MSSSVTVHTRRRRFAFIVAIATLAIGSVGLAGWAFDILTFRFPVAGFAPMRPTSAVLFILTSLTLLICARNGVSKVFANAGCALGITVAATGAYIVAAYVFGFSTFTDNFLITPDHVGAVVRNRMPWQTGLSFVFLGSAITLTLAPRKWARAAERVTMIQLIVAYGIGLGMLFDSGSISGDAARNTMSVFSLFSFMLSGTALLALNREGTFVDLFSGADVGGQTASLFLPVILIVPTLVGWLRVIGQEQGLYETAFGTATSIFTLVLLMFTDGRFLQRKDIWHGSTANEGRSGACRKRSKVPRII